MEDQLLHKQRLLPRVRRAVIKIGSSLLSTTSGIHRERLRSLCKEICGLRASGIEIVVVSSGAVACGKARFGFERAMTVPQRQAAAAVGQIELMALYEEFCAEFDVQVGQILLTHDDLADRSRYLNARHTIETLIAAGVVPVANENDTVIVEELTNFGDNDNLSALIANLVEADLLVLLSDVPGLYTNDPREHADAELVAVVADPRHAATQYAMEGRGPLGTGGMGSKFGAARKASAAGIPTIIADGLHPETLAEVVDPQRAVGTLIFPHGDRLARRKYWIAYNLRPSGTLVVDQGAHDAIVRQGRSLLPKGLKGVHGKFDSGACVRCVDPSGREFARGLVSYGSAELEQIKGLHSGRIESTLGYKLTEEIIHRNDLVLVGE
jgi:glutamate 5-kinase